MRDSYKRFFATSEITPAEFFEFGLSEVIHVPFDAAVDEWSRLKSRIENGEAVTIRSFGRNGANSHYFVSMYASVLGNDNIQIDSTNNAAPTKLLRDLTGYSKTKKRGCKLVRNYQVSHVFGRTKNPFAFTAPWNIVYLPKIVDPFTGHEAPGELSMQFQHQFRRHVQSLFLELIEDFNRIVTEGELLGRLRRHVTELDDSPENKRKVMSAINSEFQPIQIIEG